MNTINRYFQKELNFSSLEPLTQNYVNSKNKIYHLTILLTQIYNSSAPQSIQKLPFSQEDQIFSSKHQISFLYKKYFIYILKLNRHWMRVSFSSNFGIHNIIINMLRKTIRAFSTSKYFLDQKYFNFTVISHSKNGSLLQIKKIFTDIGASFTYIKSQFTNAWTQSKNFTLNISIQKMGDDQLSLMTQKLTQNGIQFIEEGPIKVPWFPTKRSDLDKIGKVLLDVKDEANKEHLQFSDAEYRKRRDFITEIAKNYKIGEEIPDVPYTLEQNQLWKNIYGKLSVLHKRAMSSRYLKHAQDLEKEFHFSQRIPQLSELDIYLKNKTGFSVKPTHGILSQREFLNCFAFKTFCCTQYIRNTKTPDYTPEPDIVHEIIGHIPMFADPQVASLSHEIGLLSLGASDQQIAMLGALYWYTLQFGACLEGKQRLGYGAGIASSISEIQNFISDKPKFQKFNPQKDCTSNYPIQTVQQIYRVTESFEQAIKQLQQFGQTINKPIQTRFNQKNQQIDYNRCIQAIDFGCKGPTF